MTKSSQAQKKVLHVGCGYPNPAKLHKIFQGTRWKEVRLDIDPNVQPDIISSITSMPRVTAGTFDAVFSSHNLEHLYPHEVSAALTEFARVLKTNGFALITSPDIQTVAELVVADRLDDVAYQSPAGPIAPIDMLFGHRASMAHGNLFMAHKTGFSAKTLKQALVTAGFAYTKVAREKKRFNLWAVAYKQKPAKVPDPITE